MRIPTRILAGLSVLAVSPGVSWAQVRAGAEFRVNTYTSGYQYVRVSTAAAAADGHFVVVWESGTQDGSGFTAMASRFDANGARLGSEFVVNTYTTGEQYFCSIGMNARGRFVVAWQSYQQDGSRAGVFAQSFESSGLRAGGEFRVNAYTTDTQSRASVGLDSAGNSVIAWRSASVLLPQDGDASGVFAQRFSATGAVQGGEFQVNGYTTEYQNRADVARAPDGAFVVAWQSYNQEGPGSGYGVYARRYAADGSSLGGEFRVNTYTTDDQARPSVAVDAAGNFVVAWTEYALRDGSLSSIRAQRFSAGGTALGSEFQVNSYTTGAQYWPQVGMALDGGAFVVAWTEYPRDGSGAGVFGRRFNSAGTAIGTEFQANSYITGNQYSGNVAVDTVGNFVLVWNSDAQDGSSTGVYAQRYGGLLPAVLNVDTGPGPNQNGNRVFEAGEGVDVRPSWRNVNGSSQTFSGALSSMTGPPGATYTIIDSTGDYGTVNDNNTGPCTSCYQVSVNNPARPAQHWDASALETLSPADQGQQKRWTLHIGNSFSDVSNASGFYRFIETLLHHAITGGCGATAYCPATPTSREQMAVFVLVAKEGSGFVPSPCTTTPMFNDVPASSPFCRWIEELARRAVVGGCGGGNYCPASSVTREQMAVFVLRTLDPTLNPPACAPPNIYNDVPETSGFCRWIEELTNRGVVTGCGGGNYCPSAAVTREQMGVFISATFGLTLYGP
jgi:S-layer family protein